MLGAITLKHGNRTTTMFLSDGGKFSVPSDIGAKIAEQIKIYFGCSFMPDWISYDIPDEEIESIETSIYQQFGSNMTAIL